MAALHRARKVRVYLFRAIGNHEFWGVVAAVTDYELFWAIDRLTNPYRVELTPVASGFAHAAQTGAGVSASEFAISACDLPGAPMWFTPKWGEDKMRTLSAARAARAPATPDYTSGTCAALAAETRTFLPTKEAAAHLGRRAQTLRQWAMAGGKGPISPVRVGGRLAWAVSDIKRLLGAPA